MEGPHTKRAVGGIIPPMITPFNREGKVYEEGLRNVIEFLVPRVDGLFICGTYGSGPLMTLERRKLVADFCIKQVGGRVPVIVHVGTADTESAVLLARAAEKSGADAVASVAPYYFTHTEQDLRSYFEALIGAVQIPVFAYNNPKASGNPLSTALISALAEKGLAGLKDSSFDIVQFYEYAKSIRKPDFTLIAGTEAIAYPALLAGAKGVVSGVANVFPEVVKALYEAVLTGQNERATELQFKVLRVREIIKMGPTIPICHAVLRMRGVDAGEPRAPFSPISSELEAKVKAELEKIGLL